MTSGRTFSVLLKFSLPMLLSVAFQQLYNIVDSVEKKTSSITALSIRRTLPRDTMEPKLSVAISNLLRDKIVFFIII